MQGRGKIGFASLMVFIALNLLVLSSPAQAPSRQAGNYLIEYELISNTDFCLTYCSLKFRFKIDRDYTIDNADKFRGIFKRVRGDANILEHGFRLGQTETYDVRVWVPDIVCRPYSMAANGTTVEMENCTDMGHYENQERERFVYEDFNPVGKTIKANEWYYIELWGRKEPKLGRDAVDAVPILGGFEFPFAIWDSYPYRYEILSNATGVYPINVNDTHAPNVWTLNAAPGEKKYLYCAVPKCTDGNWSIGNATHETYWESASSLSGFNPAKVWGDDTIVVFHADDDFGARLNDSSIYNNDGTSAGLPSQTTGKIANGILFSGTNYATVSDGSYFNTDDLTVMFWIKATSQWGDASSCFPIGKWGNPGDRAWALNIGNNGAYLRFYKTSDGTEVQYATSNAILMGAGVWYHIAVTYASATKTASFYINDQLNGSGTGTISVGGIYDGVDMTVGIAATQTGIAGAMDEIRYYNRTLSQNEIVNDYYTGINNLTALGAEEKINSTPVVSLYNITGSTTDTTPGIDFNFTDDDQYATCYLLFNGTAYAVNATTENATRTTLTVNTTLEPDDYEVMVRCSDGTSAGYSDPIILAITETIPPTWHSPQTNATNETKTGHTVHFNITLRDETSPGYYIFSFYNGTNWINDTTQSWANNTPLQIIRTISATRGKTIQWYWWFNDFAGNLNSTPVWNFTVANTPPTQSGPILNSTSGKNFSSDSLTCWSTSASDPDNDPVTSIYNWYKNSQPLALLSMPFEIDADDYSGHGNDGTIYGPTFAPGKIGNALYFDGSDYIQIPDSNSLDFTSSKSWEIWFKRSATGTAQTLFDKANLSEKPNYRLAFDPDNKLILSYYAEEEITYEDNAWTTSTQQGFNAGSYNQTHFNTTYGAVILNSLQTSGDYQSRVFNDSGETLKFQTLSWSADVPRLEELSPEPDMVSLWHFNEGSGSIAYDETPNNNDGTIYGAAWTDGKFNYALGFDGNGDYVNTSTANFPAGNENITIEAWFKIDNLNSDDCIITYGKNSGHNAIQLLHRTSDDVLALHYWGGYGAVTTPLNDNDWHHVAGVHANNTNYLYLDGELKGTTSYTNANIINSFSEIGRAVGFPSYDFSGTMDEVAIYNRTLSAAEIQNHYQKGISGALTDLSFNMRSCNQPDCSDKGGGWDITGLTTSPASISSLPDNKYAQYKAFFSTNDTDYTPKLYNATLAYKKPITIEPGLRNITSTTAITDTSGWHLATVTFTSSGNNNFRLYLDGLLDTQKTETAQPTRQDNNLYIGKRYPENDRFFDGSLDEFRIYDHGLGPDQIYNHYNLGYNTIVSQETAGGDTYLCGITPNDGYDDGETNESNDMTVLWAITFNVTSGESGLEIDYLDDIACNYSGFTYTSTENPYGPYGFIPGSYTCTFKEEGYFDRTTTFIVNNDTLIEVVMSIAGFLSLEEHYWLEKLYDCLVLGIEEDCIALRALLDINQTVTNIWNVTKPTDQSIILNETVMSWIINETSNLTIHYSIYVPPKQGCREGDYLPIRLSYWFLSEDNSTCYNQVKESFYAENPYCFPLMAQTLGPMLDTTNFTVDLRPTVPSGTYTIIRRVDIDPNGQWINYGQEVIGHIKVTQASNEPIIRIKSLTTIENVGITGMLTAEGTGIGIVVWVPSLISLIAIGLVFYVVKKKGQVI